MDYEKIGKFIQKKRKELNLTQKDIADILGVTDRAISRWERGKGCPDISLLEPLSNILKVSVLELLHGEKIKDNENEVVVNILKTNSKKIKNWKILSMSVLNILLVILISLLSLLFIFPLVMEKSPNKGVNIVISGSMMPTLEVYDLVFYNKIHVDNISIGDIIVYTKEIENVGKFPINHRVVEIRENKETDQKEFLTKGDNNIHSDLEFQTEDNILGIMTKKIPKIGKLFMALSLVDNCEIKRLPLSVTIFVTIGIIAIIFVDIVQIKKRIMA